MLPAGWAEYKDPASGNPYYHSAASGETVWTRPTLPTGADGPAQSVAPVATPQPQAAPLPQAMLPVGWTEYKDPSTGNPYYHCTASGETSWTRPTLPNGGGLGAPPPMGQQFQQQSFGNDIGTMINQAAQSTGAMSGANGRVRGIVKNWNEEKGFGFIDPVGGGENVFVHRSGLADGSILAKGATVEYETSWNAQKGKHQAYKCTGAAGTPMPQPMPTGGQGFGGPPQSSPMGGFPAPQPQGGMGIEAQPGMINSGNVKIWFQDKGFGFISPSDGSNDCYVHRTELSDGTELVVGSTVQFGLEWNPAKNKYSAKKVTGCIQGAAPPMPAMGAPGIMGAQGVMGAPGNMGAPSFMGPPGGYGQAMSPPAQGGFGQAMGQPMGQPMGMPAQGGFGQAMGQAMGQPMGMGMQDTNRFEPYPGAASAAPIGGSSS